MKRLAALTSALGLALTSTSALPGETIVVAPQSGLDFYRGYDARLAVPRETCVRPKNARVKPKPEPEVLQGGNAFESTWTKSASEWSNVQSLSIAAQLGIGLFNFAANHTEIRSLRVSSEREALFARAKVVFDRQELTDGRPSSSLSDLVEIRPDFAGMNQLEFIQRCGTGFVSAVIHGGELTATYSSNSASQASVSEMQTALKAALAANSVEATESAHVRELMSNHSIKVETTGPGGSPTQEMPLDPAGLQKYAAGLANWRTTNPRLYLVRHSFVVTSYDEIGRREQEPTEIRELAQVSSNMALLADYVAKVEFVQANLEDEERKIREGASLQRTISRREKLMKDGSDAVKDCLTSKKSSSNTKALEKCLKERVPADLLADDIVVHPPSLNTTSAFVQPYIKGEQLVGAYEYSQGGDASIVRYKGEWEHRNQNGPTVKCNEDCDNNVLVFEAIGDPGRTPQSFYVAAAGAKGWLRVPRDTRVFYRIDETNMAIGEQQPDRSWNRKNNKSNQPRVERFVPIDPGLYECPMFPQGNWKCE